jgi:ferredoxin
MPSCTVTFQPSGKTVSVPEGTVLLTAAQQAGQPVMNFCGGNGLCQTCEVRVSPAANAALSLPEPKELRWLDADDITAGRRLACCAKVTGDLAFDVPATKRFDIAGQFQKLSFEEGFQLWTRMIAATSEEFLNHFRHVGAVALNSLELFRTTQPTDIPNLMRQFVKSGLTNSITAFEAVATGLARSMDESAASTESGPKKPVA